MTWRAIAPSCVVLVLVAHGSALAADRPIARFPGLVRIFRALAVEADRDAAPGWLFDFEQVLAAVTARTAPAGYSADEYRRAIDGETTLTLPADRATIGRDEASYRLHSLGYSAREIADILSGRITRAALDTAQKMLMVGSSRESVSNFLDREYRRMADRRARGSRKATERGPAAAEAHLARFAARHGVALALARAVAACESGWDQQARSRVGAIGVMQLMPGTARELGVNPFDLEQNIEGGVRYLAWLLGRFGSVEHSLVAYNAGPAFARRYARGEVVLYGETREFIRRVADRLP